jgi:hypothetical protein
MGDEKVSVDKKHECGVEFIVPSGEFKEIAWMPLRIELSLITRQKSKYSDDVSKGRLDEIAQLVLSYQFKNRWP